MVFIKVIVALGVHQLIQYDPLGGLEACPNQVWCFKIVFELIVQVESFLS